MEFHPIYGLSIPERGWVPAPRYLMRRDRILKIMESLPGGRILEVGCGSGALLYDLSQMGFKCTGLETSPPALDIASYVHQNYADVEI